MLPTWEELQAQTAWARERGAAVHMDGARLWESAPYYGRSYAEISALFDSVYVSFYKGIGAMAGSALAGSAEFIAEARVWQVRHGGRIIHLFPYVLSARTKLRQRLDRFPHYHERAVAIAAVLRAVPGIVVKPDPPQTHMMHVYLHGDPERLTAAALDMAREEQRRPLPRPAPDRPAGLVDVRTLHRRRGGRPHRRRNPRLLHTGDGGGRNRLNRILPRGRPAKSAKDAKRGSYRPCNSAGASAESAG